MEKNTLLTTLQLAKTLQVSRQSIINWRKEGMPVAICTGNMVRFVLSDVVYWLNNRKTKRDNEINAV
tara:strand:+ start:113 stop:313 length:201 start_codon:yes stop_codon:yes gene_type:complete